MNRRIRKLIGTIVLLVFLLVYIAIAGAIGSGRISEASSFFQFAYFIAAGLLWVPPAALLIRWMVRPD